MKKQKILNWAWYGFENLGDDLLMNTMLRHIHGDVTVPMKTPYAMPNVKQVKRSYKELVLGAFHYDVLIIGLGGLFPFDNRFKVLIYYLITRLWILKGRKVIFFGIGISEDMSSISAVLWNKIAKSVNLFIPRSEKVLVRLGFGESEKIHSMADCVFASKVVSEVEDTRKNRIAISVANIQDTNEKAFIDAVSKWSSVVKALTQKGFKVDLIAFTRGSDDRMIRAILERTKNMEGGVRPIYYTDVSNAVDSWNKYKFAICMRFHSLALSILNDVPAIPIAYGYKTLSLAEKCGLGDYTLVWNTFQTNVYLVICLWEVKHDRLRKA